MAYNKCDNRFRTINLTESPISSPERLNNDDIKIAETPNIFKNRKVIWLQEAKPLFPIVRQLFPREPGVKKLDDSEKSDDPKKERLEDSEPEESYDSNNADSKDTYELPESNNNNNEKAISYTTEGVDLLHNEFEQLEGCSIFDIAYEVEIE